jgi:hypothetical protein
MRSRRRAAPAGASLASLLALAIALAGCGGGGAARPDAGSDGGSDSESALAGGVDEVKAQPSLKDLGPSGRRVKVIVLPGDAAVEVDGVAARRRDGVIELLGKVGEVRRLRVARGAESTEETVTIQESGASPPLIDLRARAPRLGGKAASEPAAPSAPGDPLSIDNARAAPEFK